MYKLVERQNRYRSLNRNFSGLMELYETNYLSLRRLIPKLDFMPEQAVSIAKEGLDLHFSSLEQCKYTHTFSLSYCFQHSDGKTWAPDLQIRMYYDARVAEVISGMLHRHYLHRNGERGYRFCNDLSLNTVVNRWRLNRFLDKWLKFCLKQGHSFRHVFTAKHAQTKLLGLFQARD